MRPTKAPTKAASQRAHFRRRLRERYGLRINREGIRALAAKVARGEYRLVLEQSLRVRVLALYWEGKVVVLAWDAGRGEPVTALGRDSWRYADGAASDRAVPPPIVLQPTSSGYTWTAPRPRRTATSAQGEEAR